MRIEIQRASNLGALHNNLNIDADSRISLELKNDGSLEIWDLSTGNYFVAKAFISPSTIDRTHIEVPKWLSEIVTTPDQQLLEDYKARWQEGAGEQRMAMFTELCYRGINVL